MKKIQYSVSMYLSNPSDQNSDKVARGKIQLTGVVGIEEMADHIQEHNSVFSRGTIIGVLAELGSCVREFLIQGYKVSLSNLGTFCPSITCKAAETRDEFSANNITSMPVIFSPGSDLKNLIDKAEFEKTSTRAAQAATLAAQMAGKTTVDLTTSTTSDDDGSTDDDSTDDEGVKE